MKLPMVNIEYLQTVFFTSAAPDVAHPVYAVGLDPKGADPALWRAEPPGRSDFERARDHAASRQAAFARNISSLARAHGEEIFFHENKNAADGPHPVAANAWGGEPLLIECREEFLEKIAKLPGIGAAREVPPEIETHRSSRLHEEYGFRLALLRHAARPEPKKPGGTTP